MKVIVDMIMFVISQLWKRIVRVWSALRLDCANTSGLRQRTATAADNVFDVVHDHIRGCWRHRLDSRSTSVCWTSVGTVDGHRWTHVDWSVTTAVQLMSSMDT